MATEADIKHLLRRTEFVARPARVEALLPLTIEQAVDNILDVEVDPGSVTFQQTANWQRGEELTHFWLDRMAHDSPRPIQEKIGFFWHGHFCSDLSKAESAVLMCEQIDLFRREGLGNFRELAIAMSTQVAMLRYLDNNQNQKSSPNQNFARELMELFILGVGNYTEADVEAGAAAWTGHTDKWDDYVNPYRWQREWHDANPKTYLGRTINQGLDWTKHGQETIEVMLGPDAKVPAGAAVVANRGRLTRDVAAEFVSRKLWTFFAGTTPPAAVISQMRDAAIANDFAIKPWVRAMLVRSEFYTAAVKQGLVRSPVDSMVAMLAATGLRSKNATPLWLMEGMGQRPLFPPDVSGWKHNGYFVSASAMTQRTEVAGHVAWRAMDRFWESSGPNAGLIRLRGGNITKAEVQTIYNATKTDKNGPPTLLVDRILELMQVGPVSTTSRAALVSFSTAAEDRWWERPDLIRLTLLIPELHVA